jgi:hypothetical protein
VVILFFMDQGKEIRSVSQSVSQSVSRMDSCEHLIDTKRISGFRCLQVDKKQYLSIDIHTVFSVGKHTP